MEKRGLLVAMLLAVSLIVLWNPIVDFVGKKMGWDMTQPIAQSNADNRNATPATAPTSQQVAAGTTMPATSMPGEIIATTVSGPAEPAEIGSGVKSDPTYKMLVRINPTGAGLDSVTLNEFMREVRKPDSYIFQQPYSEDENGSRPLATRSITVDGKKTELSNVQWSNQNASKTDATFDTTLAESSKPLVKLAKTISVLPSSDPSSGYELSLTQSIQNLSDRPLQISLQYNGTVNPPREQDRGGERQTLAGYNVGGGIEVVHDAIESYSEKVTAKEYAKDKQGNAIVWAGTMSSYFQALLRPMSTTSSTALADYIQDVTANAVGLSPNQAGEDRQICFTFTTKTITVAAGTTLTLPARAYFGPRQRALLNDAYYATFPIDYGSTLVLTSGPCGVCTFQWLIDLLVNLLRVFHFIFRDWGLAIIGLVLLVRAILHPITKRSQISMSKMGKMGPEMERLKKRLGDNKEELQKAMWELQKEQGIGPYLGCAPMFLQMPIWIALWQALYTTFELRQAPFLWGFTWIHDLSKPDHLLTWAPIPVLFGWKLSGLNILPILMGVVFFFQMKFQPKPAAATPEQEQQQKMMQMITPFIFPIMLYSGPSGLNLYIMTSTFIGIVESKIVRDHLKQREEDEKGGRVIVDAGRKISAKPGVVSRVQPDAPAKPGGMMGWLQQLQERAEQLRKKK